MHAMGSLTELLYEWEIQLLVLLSFMLQMFLLFTGSLRRHSTNTFLTFSIWAAYLGADLVAVYALGYLSQHEEIATGKHIPRRTQQLAFFWAPFLLIHLGGQDTITAFAMEDNNLWLRHLLDLVVQVVLALYVFWKSIGRHNVELLISGIFVFVAGIIKYGERIWSLKCGRFKSLESSIGQQYTQRLPPVEVTLWDAVYANTVCIALHSMRHVLDIFSARRLFSKMPVGGPPRDPKIMLKVVGLELGMMYDDLYTKALVLRTRSGIIVRCISQISALVAFALFFTGDKQIYGRADTAITYSLFIGGFFLDLCSVFIFLMSPWTWAWLKARECNRLASVSWFLVSSGIGWPEKKTRWPNSMGQYNLVSWLIGRDNPRTFNHRVMAMVVRLVNLVGVEKGKIFWMSKMLDTDSVEVDNEMMECVLKGIRGLHDEFSSGPREWPNLYPMLIERRGDFVGDFGNAIVMMHLFTVAHLGKYPPSLLDIEANAAAATDFQPCGMVDVCRKLSNYMMYLLVNHPSMLPLNTSAVATLERLHRAIEEIVRNSGKDAILRWFKEIKLDYDPEPGREILEELVEMWARLLLYAAGKSRAEMHACQLSGGGELLTFLWLLMAHQQLGESGLRRIRLINASGSEDLQEVYAFYVLPAHHRPSRPRLEASNR